jgi:sugar lactone lactonase YvrE
VQAIAAGQLTFVGIQSSTGLCTNGACVAPVVTIGNSSSGFSPVFEVPAGLTIGSFNYVDQGIAGATSEYNALTPDTNPNACKTGTYATTTTCNADYVFSPSYPGSRYGALQVLGTSGNVLATVYLGGTGVGPELAFSPALQTTVGTGLRGPQGVFVDGFGNVYIANTTGDSIIKVTSAGLQNTIPITGLTPATLEFPGGAAVDGVGNIYIADYGNYRVVKVPWNGSAYGTATTIGSRLATPNDVAVDGNGNVYIANQGCNTIVKVPWNGAAYGTQVTVPTPTFSGSSPTGVAVDGNLNVYVADWAGGTVQKIPWTGTAYGTAVRLGSGLSRPFNVSVDANSNVYIADSGNDRVVIEPWTGSAYGAQTVVANANNGLASPTGVSVDGNGNVYIADQTHNRILKLGNSTGASLTFATPTNVGSKDTTDGPLSFTVVNVGNAPLTISIPGSGTNPVFPSGFSFDSSSSCPNVSAGGSAGTIPQGGTCYYAVNFTPTVIDTNSGSLVLTDDFLHASNAVEQLLDALTVGQPES